jgi:hypothetical protein
MAGAVHDRGRRRAHPRQDAQGRASNRLRPPPCSGSSIWRWDLDADQLAPHRFRTFKLSTDPDFAKRKSQWERWSMPLSTTIPPTSTQRYADGWRVIRVGRSTLLRPPRPGLTPSKASSPSSRASALSAASSNRSLTCNSPSTASSPIPMPTPNHWSGPPTQNASSQPLSAGTKHWSQSTNLRRSLPSKTRTMVNRNTSLYIIRNVVTPRLGTNSYVYRRYITLTYSQYDIEYTCVHPHPSQACW